MQKTELQQLSDKIDEIARRAIEAAESAKASASIAYTASVENVKSNKNLEAKLDEYIKDDTVWKERAEPVIQLGNDARSSSKAVLYLAGIVIAIGGAYFMIRKFFQ